MNKFVLVCLTFCCSVTTLFAQSDDERLNRAMYNRIEYFFNLQEADSIYALASPDFQQQISKSQLSNILEQLFSLGKITDATYLQYDRGLAQYKADFGARSFTITVGLNAEKTKYDALVFQPYMPADAPGEVKKEPVIANVETVDPLDFSIDSIARVYIQQQHAQALTVAVIHKGQIKKYFYGETEPGSDATPDANSVFEIGSITKTFTATLLADLVEKNVVDLDDSIGPFLPDSLQTNPSLAAITFRELATHTSGLPRLPENLTAVSGYDERNPYATYDRAALFSFLRNYEIEADRKEQYLYSNVGYGLLGELISLISNNSYEQQLQSTLLTPLHMNSTYLAITSETATALPVYNAKGDVVPTWDFQALAGTGAVKSTLDDMLRYAVVQLRRPESELEQAMALTKMFNTFIPPNTDIGLAWHMNMIEDMTCLHHTGGTGGSSSFIGLIPDSNSAVIVLSNAELSVAKAAMEMVKTVILTK